MWRYRLPTAIAFLPETNFIPISVDRVHVTINIVPAGSHNLMGIGWLLHTVISQVCTEMYRISVVHTGCNSDVTWKYKRGMVFQYGLLTVLKHVQSALYLTIILSQSSQSWCHHWTAYKAYQSTKVLVPRHSAGCMTVVCRRVAHANNIEHAQHFREATHSSQCKIKLEKEKEESDIAGFDPGTSCLSCSSLNLLLSMLPLK